MSADRIPPLFWSLIVLSLIGLWPILVFAVGVMFLLYVVRLVLLVWVGAAVIARAAFYDVRGKVVGS